MIVIYSLLASPALAAAEGNKIVKWVDSKGVTQYGDKLPASAAGRNNAEMNPQGMVIKKNVIADKSNDLQGQQRLEQERKDKVLLASYTKAEEIDLARERNLQLDKSALQALSQQKTNVSARLATTSKLVDSITSRNKPVPPHLSNELKSAKLKIAEIDKQLTQRKLNMAATNARYTEEKARFIALKQATPQPAPQANNMAATLTTQR